MSLQEDLLKKAKGIREKNEKTLAQIPEKYQHYVQTLSRTSKVSSKILNIGKELEEAGYYVTEGKGTFLKIDQPYLTVAGKNAILVNWAEEKDYRFSIDNEIVFLHEKPFIKATVLVTDENGTEIRKGNSTVPVNIGGSGVDRTNPYENAETSAVGRALTFIGMGHQMADIASYEEVLEAQRRQNDPPAQDTQQPEQDQGQGEPVYSINSLEFKDQSRRAGILRLVDAEGEVIEVAGWGKVFTDLIRETQKGNLITIKTEPFTTRTQEQAQRLIEYKVVA